MFSRQLNTNSIVSTVLGVQTPTIIHIPIFNHHTPLYMKSGADTLHKITPASWRLPFLCDTAAMDEVQQDKSVLQNLLKAWHKKKNIRCPTCKASLFHFDETPYFSSVFIKYEIVLIHHSPCPSSIGNCGRGLFFCLSCGGQSSHTLGRLQDRGCKCVEVNLSEEKSSPISEATYKES